MPAGPVLAIDESMAAGHTAARQMVTELDGYRGLPPNRFAWVDEIPRNAMGKAMRTQLRDALDSGVFDGPIRDHARWTPRAPAVVMPHRTVSYGQFNADIDRMGAGLVAQGLTRDSGVVALGIPSAYPQYVAMAALARLGVPSSTFADDAADLRLSDSADDTGPGVLRLDAAWLAPGGDPAPAPLPILDLEPDALMRVLLSSGTTARPRRVPFSRQRIDANTLANLRVYGAGKSGLWIPLTGIDSLLGFNALLLLVILAIWLLWSH
eukprot:gene13291-17658_t